MKPLSMWRLPKCHAGSTTQQLYLKKARCKCFIGPFLMEISFDAKHENCGYPHGTSGGGSPGKWIITITRCLISLTAFSCLLFPMLVWIMLKFITFRALIPQRSHCGSGLVIDPSLKWIRSITTCFFMMACALLIILQWHNSPQILWTKTDTIVKHCLFDF